MGNLMRKSFLRATIVFWIAFLSPIDDAFASCIVWGDHPRSDGKFLFWCEGRDFLNVKASRRVMTQIGNLIAGSGGVRKVQYYDVYHLNDASFNGNVGGHVWTHPQLKNGWIDANGNWTGNPAPSTPSTPSTPPTPPTPSQLYSIWWIYQASAKYYQNTWCGQWKYYKTAPGDRLAALESELRAMDDKYMRDNPNQAQYRGMGQKVKILPKGAPPPKTIPCIPK